jgi:PIN domain nuclease of toxin-antitoxin system
MDRSISAHKGLEPFALTSCPAHIEEISGINICEISAEIAAESIALQNNFHGDPADRIIVATARSYSATLFTRDKQILEWSADGAVKCLEV